MILELLPCFLILLPLLPLFDDELRIEQNDAGDFWLVCQIHEALALLQTPNSAICHPLQTLLFSNIGRLAACNGVDLVAEGKSFLL